MQNIPSRFFFTFPVFFAVPYPYPEWRGSSSLKRDNIKKRKNETDSESFKAYFGTKERSWIYLQYSIGNFISVSVRQDLGEGGYARKRISWFVTL